MILMKDVGFSYKDKVILKNASLEIPDGCIVSLLGESGIGKSTVAKILCGLLKPSSGLVEMEGKTLVSNEKAYDRPMGLGIQMVHQHPNISLDPRQKVGAGMVEIVRFHHMVEKGQESGLVLKTAGSVGLDSGTLNHLPMQISGGEAQRVSLARALLFSPKLLILDEATSMLDVSTQANVLGLARQVQVERGASILLITHDHELSESYSDIEYTIENKRIRRVK